MKKPNIVILGAGYGGLITTVKLQKMLGNNDVNLTLVNKHDYHYQTTWLHENAAGTLHHDRTRIAIKEVVNLEKVNFVRDTVISIKPDKKKVKLKSGELSYDYLVIGLGFEAATFGIPGLNEHAFNIRSINSTSTLGEIVVHFSLAYDLEGSA